jgi:hypothetical protein
MQKLLEVAHAVLQDHLAQVKKDIQATRNLKNREECQEKGRRENALRAFEEDRRRVKERCEKEKTRFQHVPQRAGSGIRSGSESLSNSSDDEF